MEIIELNERITFYSKQKTKQPNGEVTYGYSEFDTVWANVRPISGSERFVGDGENYTKKYAFKVRHRSDLNEDMIISFDGNDFDVINIEPYYKGGRNNYIYVEAEASQNTEFTKI